jgi:hypothetical protein
LDFVSLRLNAGAELTILKISITADNNFMSMHWVYQRQLAGMEQQPVT